MNRLSVNIGAIGAYGAATDAMSAQIEGAAAAMTACGPLVLTPAFGLIGTEFLGAFTAAHTAHAAAVTQLAHVVGSLGVATASSAAGYEQADVATAVSIEVHR